MFGNWLILNLSLTMIKNEMSKDRKLFKKKKKKLTTIWIFQHKLITRNMTETKKCLKLQKKKKKKQNQIKQINFMDKLHCYITNLMFFVLCTI